MTPRSICHYSTIHICQTENLNSTWIVINEAIFFMFHNFTLSFSIHSFFVVCLFRIYIERISKRNLLNLRDVQLCYISMHLVLSLFSFFILLSLQYRRRISRSTNMFATSKTTNVKHLYKSTAYS